MRALAAICVVLTTVLPSFAVAEAPKRLLLDRSEMPLYGKTILYTAPRNYAGRLGGLLIERGAQPVWMPTIVIEPMADYTLLDQALRNRRDFEWVAFSSRNGIEAFLGRMEALGLRPADVGDMKFAAIGNDSRALEAAGIEPDLVPTVASTKGMVSELAAMGVKEGDVLVPAPDVVGMEEPLVIPEFIEALQGIGLRTHRVPAYVTARATDGLSIGTDLLLAGKIDMLAFTSRGEIESLLLHLGERRDALDDDLSIACFGPVTATGARLRKLRVDVQAKDYSRFEGFVAAMENYYLDRRDTD